MTCWSHFPSATVFPISRMAAGVLWCSDFPVRVYRSHPMGRQPGLELYGRSTVHSMVLRGRDPVRPSFMRSMPLTSHPSYTAVHRTVGIPPGMQLSLLFQPSLTARSTSVRPAKSTFTACLGSNLPQSRRYLPQVQPPEEWHST